MTECELITLINTVTCMIAQNFDTDDIDLLSAIFTQLGDSLTTISTLRARTKPEQTPQNPEEYKFTYPCK